MPSATSSVRSLPALLLLAMLLATPLPAQDAPRPGLPVYLDLAAAAMGAGFQALHMRAGVQPALSGRWSCALEGHFYASAPADTVFLQAGATGLLRFRPWRRAGLYFGAGPGLSWSDSYFKKEFGGTAAYQDLRVSAYAIAELGWSLGFRRLALYLEPFAQGFAAFGPGWANGGPAAWSSFAGGDLGLRAGWRF